jgi:hypothetical protein
MGTMLQAFSDMRLAWRSLRRSPGFALAVILTLGIALGANGAMFGIADRLLFSDPPHIVQPDHVFRVLVSRRQPQGFLPRTPAMSYAAFTDIRDRTTSFTHVAASTEAELSLGSGINARLVATRPMPRQYFPISGAPIRGRFFTEDDRFASAGSPVGVVGHQLWRTAFGGAIPSSARGFVLNEAPFEIIGVAPRVSLARASRRVDLGCRCRR